MQSGDRPPSNHFLPILGIHAPPEFTIGNMTNYFITRITSDGKSANDFKTDDINSSAFSLFKDGHIQNIQAYITPNKIYYQADCLPEMKNITYTIRLTLNSNNGDIQYARCGCAAGNGPTGSCKHIPAMCYALEDFLVFTNFVIMSCTFSVQTWNQPW